jgi:hypothetical protein
LSFGCLWDSNNYDVTSALNVGDTSANAAVTTSGTDCVTWVAQAFATGPSAAFTNAGYAASGVGRTTRAPERSTSPGSRQLQTGLQGRTSSGRSSTTSIRAAGDGTTSPGTVSGPVGGPFTVSGSHTYIEEGSYSVKTTITDNVNSSNTLAATSTATVAGSTATAGPCTVLTYEPVPFVIGDGNSAVGTDVTFWGAQWWKLNTLSGGAAPGSFKGFALEPSTPSCGTNWTTAPGNSPPPPAGPLPSFIGVIVASSISQSGSQISGDTVHMVVVETNPGYGSNPGHAGTGTVVAQIC